MPAKSRASPIRSKPRSKDPCAELKRKLKERDAELKEAGEQHAAVSAILRAISGTATDVKPVLLSIAERAMRLCGSHDARIWLKDGDRLKYITGCGGMAPVKKGDTLPITRDGPGRAVLERKPVHIRDAAAVSEEEFPWMREIQRLHGHRTVVIVPLMRNKQALGTIVLRKMVVEPFSKRQIELVRTFADQAAIAIENVRLFTELQARNAEVTEALEQQTATSEVLKVISRSTFDLQPVLDTLIENAARLCGAESGIIYRFERDVLRMAANYAASTELKEYWRRAELRPGPGSATGRAVLERRTVHIPDVLADPRYEMREAQRVSGFRTLLCVPMLREGVVLGVISTLRNRVDPFTDKQIALLETFANQAVIAIENVRLFNETKEALEQQTVISEILRIISSSLTDTQPVFDAIAKSGVHHFGGMDVTLRLVKGGQLETVASTRPNYAFRTPLDDEGAPAARSILRREVVQVPDYLAAEPWVSEGAKQNAERRGFRAVMSAPMLRENDAIGTINVMRATPGPFTDKQVALLQTFANQAVIAIENVRLFKELQAQTEALSRSVNQLTALGEVGQAISSTLDLETVLQTIVSRALQLSGLDSGSIYEYDQQAQVFRLQATDNMPEEITAAVRASPVRAGDGLVGRTAVTHELTQVPDILDASYRSGRRDLLLRAGYRALLAVPLLREEQLLGVLLVSRKTPGAFAPEIIELLKTFATQSALAIQNARLFREIAEKSRQLEEASQHKSQFLASMSHELRTPLNAILGFNEMILDEIYGPVTPDVRSPLEEMQASGKHLLRLINNVLDLAKIEAGRMELSLQDYSVHDTVESVRSTLRSIAAEKGLELLTVVPADMPLAHGDPGRMSQCLLNLAGNALKFTKAGKVEIKAKLEGDQLVYRVSDTGIGIPADKIESLFTEFKQTDATIASEYGGTGLGLSITKKFIEMHGGRIWVESELGKGSAFIFAVPLRAKTT